ncbi:hypothetical protein TI05_15900 [Achromatium sp. WMS3]|nr:hypothetical protein TI05_15900 [Achromatium sp. WMS3]
MTQTLLENALIAEMLNIPDTWVIFDAKKKGNEVWIFLRPKETPLSDNLRTEVLRHLEVFGSKTYLKLYYSTEEEINKLPIYTASGFCKPFVMDVNKMFGTATDASICNLYGLTRQELENIKKECTNILS